MMQTILGALLRLTSRRHSQILLPSVRNSESGNLSLLHELHITKFLCSEDVVPKIEQLRANKPDLNIHTVPLIERMMEEPTTHYPYNKTFEEAQNDPIIICHTSGSTGAPKPILLTNVCLLFLESLAPELTLTNYSGTSLHTTIIAS